MGGSDLIFSKMRLIEYFGVVTLSIYVEKNANVILIDGKASEISWPLLHNSVLRRALL